MTSRWWTTAEVIVVLVWSPRGLSVMSVSLMNFNAHKVRKMSKATA